MRSLYNAISHGYADRVLSAYLVDAQNCRDLPMSQLVHFDARMLSHEATRC